MISRILKKTERPVEKKIKKKKVANESKQRKKKKKLIKKSEVADKRFSIVSESSTIQYTQRYGSISL